MAKVPNGVVDFNRLSRVHERYRQASDRRQTDGRQHTVNVNVTFAKNESVQRDQKSAKAPPSER